MEPIDDAPLKREELAEIARSRASFCAFVNAHFTTLPDPGFVERIRSEEIISALGALADDHVLHTDVTTGASLMLGYLRSTAHVEPSELSEKLGVDRTRLYRGLAPNYGPPPPCEAVWSRRSADTTVVLQELAAIYRESGMAISPEARERLDYIGVELDYQRQLALREAEAWQAGDDQKAGELLRRQADFLSEHMGQWVPPFIEKALSMAETDFYRGHLVMLRGFLAGEEERIQALLEETEGIS